MDAWFNATSAAPQLPYAESLAMACLAQLPLADESPQLDRAAASSRLNRRRDTLLRT
jgi:hypothetical protein